MSFSLDFSSPISTGDFQCLDDYMLSHSVNEYKTYSDLCSLSLSSITSLQTALNLIRTAVTDLLSMPQSFTYLKNISTFISLKIISNQLSDILHTVVSSEKKFIFIDECEPDDTVPTFKAKEIRSFSRQTTKEYTTKTIFEDVTPTFKTFNKDINIKDMLSAVQEMKEKKMITPQERDVLKEKIIEKEENFMSVIGIENIIKKDKNEIIRNMRRYLKGFY